MLPFDEHLSVDHEQPHQRRGKYRRVIEIITLFQQLQQLQINLARRRPKADWSYSKSVCDRSVSAIDLFLLLLTRKLSEIVRMAEGVVTHFMTLIKSPLEHAAVFGLGQIASNREKSSLDPALGEEIEKPWKRFGVEAGGISIDARIDQTLVVLIVIKVDADADLQ